ncbi:MAG: STAS domain-containing protein [Uliginosibacterium sp.]|jgi:SulP family sulfate permease|nr:STAS domain-containing protein [Uliginosibacterium sp.]
MTRFQPKLRETLRGYNKKLFVNDLSAGLTVGVLAVPLAMAFAIASGVTPSAGLWTAIIAGFIISALGGSRVQIGGPTGAFIPILFAIAATHGIHNMLAATFLAGILLVVMGLTRMGSLIRFIPVSVVIGFTNGIAVVIGLSQIKDLLGLQVDSLPAEFFARMEALVHYLPTLDWRAAALAIGTMLLVFSWSRVVDRFPKLMPLPAQLVGLVAGTLVSVLLNLPIETIGSRFHGIPQQIPVPSFPLPSLSSLGQLLAPAITIALLGAIESLLSARVADNQIDDRHDPNQELLAQGIANIATPFFGGIAATGAIARTSTNVKAGGRTPIAGIIHALTLLLIVLVAAPLADWIPISVLAAIVMVTAVRMGEWHEFGRLRHFSWNYRIILLATFLLTVLFDLTIAVEIGMVLASLFFIYRMQDLTSVETVKTHAPACISVHRLRGSLFFGAVAKLDALLDPAEIDALVVVLDMSAVLNIDTSGVDWLQALTKALARKGCTLVLCGLEKQPDSILRRSGLIALIGLHNICTDQQAALLRSRELLDETA